MDFLQYTDSEDFLVFAFVNTEANLWFSENLTKIGAYFKIPRPKSIADIWKLIWSDDRGKVKYALRVGDEKFTLYTLRIYN